MPSVPSLFLSPIYRPIRVRFINRLVSSCDRCALKRRLARLLLNFHQEPQADNAMKPEPAMRSTDRFNSESTSESASEADRKRKQHIYKGLIGMLLDSICGAFDQMINASVHPHAKLFNYHRARLIMKRVRATSAFLASSAALWAATNFYVLPIHLAASLASGLVLAAAVFAVLAFERAWTPSAGGARLAIGLVLTVLAALFIFSAQILWQTDLNAGDRAAASAYTLLPFVCVAGLAVVPLTLAELILFMLPALSIFLTFFLTHNDNLIWGYSPIALSVVLLSIVVVTGISSLSQLNLMQGMLRQSLRDSVTRALNRRSGELILDLQLAKAKRTGSPLTVVFLDLNNFKQVNDRLGHATGDEILRCVANFLRTGLRASDALVRWGGDEFLLILPRAAEADVTRRLTALMDRDSSPTFHGWHVTWSIGTAQWPNESAKDSRTALLAMADSRMYLAKHRCDSRTKAA